MKENNFKTIGLRIAYDGSNYFGWQRQSKQDTIQEKIEEALKILHAHPVTLYGAGRTDSKVNARGQYASFVTDMKNMKVRNFALALNSLLPQDIRVLSSEERPQDFHARFSALKRQYRYFILAKNIQDPFLRRYSLPLYKLPRLNFLNSMAKAILGEKDFSTFASVNDISKSKYRNIYSSVFYFDGPFIIYKIIGNAFLLHMVRSLIGTMIETEVKSKTEEDANKEFLRILESKNRSEAGTTAPAKALFLWDVEY